MQLANYEQLILKGIRGLPKETLKEISDFVLFKRKQSLQNSSFTDELFEAIIEYDLQKLNAKEITHLEAEFKNYEKKYPKN